MKKLLLGALMAATMAFGTACASEDVPMTTTWQVTNVYVDPDVPSVPPLQAIMVFGDSTVTGSTGCGQFQGLVRFEPDSTQPTAATFQEVRFDDVTCDGAPRFFHDHLVDMLDGEFEVQRDADSMLLTKTGEFDRPGVRLVASR